MRKIMISALVLILSSMLFGEVIDFPIMFEQTTSRSGVDVTEFYPIGWSETGYFAYMQHDNMDDGIGQHTDFYVAIQDLVTDEIIWDFEYFSETEAITVQQVWYDNMEISRTMDDYGIVMMECEFESFPFRYGWRNYDADILWDTVSDEMYTPSSYSVKIWKGNRNKNIASDVEAYVEDIEAYGAFISPYEDRFAVVVQEYQYGFEGPPYEVEIAVYGCHAKAGF